MKTDYRNRRIGTLCFFLFLFTLLIASSASAAPRLKKSSLKLKMGNAYILRLQGTDDDDNVTWRTSAEGIVGLVSGNYDRAVLKANRTGTAMITASVGGRTLSCKVKVKKNSAFPAKLTLCEGDSFTFRTDENAEWSLSNQTSGTLSATSGVMSVFTARTMGKVTLTADEEDDFDSCVIKVIRKDGSTQTAPVPVTPTDPVVTVTEQQKSVFASLSASACGRMLGSGGIAPCNVHAMDLTDSVKAFMLYEYIYKYTGAFDTDADLSISGSGIVKYITPDTLQALCTHLFGEVNNMATLNLFIKNYAKTGASGTYEVEVTGDFGDAGLFYFEKPASVTQNNGMYCATGGVKVWNANMNSYVHSYNYKAYWYLHTAQRTGQRAGVDTWFQFDHVEVS